MDGMITGEEEGIAALEGSISTYLYNKTLRTYIIY